MVHFLNMENLQYTASDRVLIILAGSKCPGGMYNYLLSWQNELEKIRAKYMIVASRDTLAKITADDKVELPYDIDNVSVSKTYMSLLKDNSVLSNDRFYDTIVQFNPTKVHIVDETLFFPFYVRLIKRLNVKSYITVHDPIYHPGQFKNKLHTRLAAFIGRLQYFRCRNLILHFHGKRHLGLSIPKLFPRKVLAPHPLPKTLVNVDHKKSTGPINIGFIGKLAPYKGINFLLAVLTKYEAKYGHSGMQFSLIGDGEYDHQAFDALKMAKKRVEGFLEETDFHKEMASLDIVTLPYISATQSGVGYMAKAYNKKLICNPVGNLPDLIQSESDGIVCSRVDEEDFLASLHKLVEDLREAH